MASSSTLQLSSTLTSGTSRTTVSPTNSSTSSDSSQTSSSANDGYGNSPFAPSSGQNTQDGLPGGPNIYLYGFLATLVLIFLVSVAVAWKGYHTRRLLRVRIEEAIARGVYIPGYGDPPDLRRQRRPVGPKPVMWEGWIEKSSYTNTQSEGEARSLLDIKPVCVSAMRPIPDSATPTSQRPTSPVPVSILQRCRQRIRRAFAPVGEYWFGYPSDSTSDSRRAELAALESEQKEASSINPEELLKEAEDIKASVIIIMPSSDHRVYRAKGKRVSRTSQSRSDVIGDHSSEIVETTTANHGSRHEQEVEELPELALGVTAVVLQDPTPMLSSRKETEASGPRPSTSPPFTADHSLSTRSPN